jgi:hypothetical protein
MNGKSKAVFSMSCVRISLTYKVQIIYTIAYLGNELLMEYDVNNFGWKA